MTFGLVSQRERQNADLFFAELLGGGTPRLPVPRYNTEAFFEALLGEEDSPSSELTPLLEAEEGPPDTGKAPTVTPGSDADEIIVTRADGTRYHVRRKVRAHVLTRPGRPRVGFCTDDERVFFRLAWCEGTQGRIDAGANPQGAFKDLIDKVLNQISQGASPEQIKQTFENAPVQTFLDVDITKVGSWKLTGDVKLDINKTGITSATAKVSADAGWIKVGVEYKDGPDGKQVLATVDIPLGERKIKGKECPVRELAVWWEVECLREIPINIKLKPPIPYIEKYEKLFLYFDYARDTLRRDPKGTAVPTDEVDAILKSDPKAGTARLNKRALERLDSLIGQGYWLNSVNGYTSPEGRRPGPKPSDRGLAAKWEGNEALSLERAEKTRKLIQARYSFTLSMRSPRMRFPSDQQMPQVVGRSENPMLNDRLGAELEGVALDRAMILGDTALGVKPFLEDHPEELARMTDEDRKFVTDKRNPVRDRAGKLFENLRRVEINLKHREALRGATIASYTLEHEQNCPQDLIEAAERKWGSRIPFTKPDPPLCK
jgi:hypothetical protein